ncbi:unnamed protein product (macronuclear) [Paramecium tetraurelia]|uniref:Uncharacterized protein n=2 Tax=Paramecium TaxID=5884 RepID=A0E727_PARTE|nr:uncharacterized protein GSPATT00023822001 [Paramecium tetraurelia]CAD8194245.1 unnamed protein product [Paramecium octaurelia]CAD8194249.1 unnamed protein product [Paramecium octaurelia]CAK91094.1 unnamed protein product [Paramecium tetraurelia]|eukprot:XP_001458491.1 hypothetical protein (macronuclear) [Paramecium tetraurelia strain d4-2]
MSEEKSLASASKSITKKPCSWKQMFRKKNYEEQKKREELRKLGEEIAKTEEFLQNAWTLVAKVLNSKSLITQLK